MKKSMKEYDQNALSELDGSRDGQPIVVALNGKVYDVSTSKLWKGGMHMKRHHAGQDLTADFPAAPHGEEVLERVRQIGILTPEREKPDQRLPSWLLRFLGRYPFFRRHPHPMLVHYPIVFMFSVTAFTLLALITGYRSFETTAFHCLAAALLFTPLAMGTGFLTWWINYQARSMRQVYIKIFGSILLLLDAGIIFSWRVLVPDILGKGGLQTFFYILLICAIVPIVSIIGWFGAGLTFPLTKKKNK